MSFASWCGVFSVNLGGDFLLGLGIDAATVNRTMSWFAEYDHRLIAKQYAVNKDEALLIQTARDAARELEQLFEADTEINQQTASANASAGQPAANLDQS